MFHLSIKAWSITALILMAVIEFIQHYIYSDFNYLIWLGILMALDTVLGISVAWKQHVISKTGFGKALKKILIYIGALIGAHILKNFEVEGVKVLDYAWIHTAVCCIIMGKEGLSVFENINKLKPIWKNILKRFQDFNEEGQPIEP